MCSLTYDFKLKNISNFKVLISPLPFFTALCPIALLSLIYAKQIESIFKTATFQILLNTHLQVQSFYMPGLLPLPAWGHPHPWSVVSSPCPIMAALCGTGLSRGGTGGRSSLEWWRRLEWGSECSGSETGRERKLTPGRESRKKTRECYPLLHWDVARVVHAKKRV